MVIGESPTFLSTALAILLDTSHVLLPRGSEPFPVSDDADGEKYVSSLPSPLSIYLLPFRRDIGPFPLFVFCPVGKNSLLMVSVTSA